MNLSVIIYVLGWVMNIEAAFMLLPCIVSVIYGESEGFAFLWVLLAAALVGTIIVSRKPKDIKFYLKESFAAVALSWILLSVIGCLPFYINGDIPHFADALFETVSGFTTTGSTVIANVEGMARCSLFWRSFTNWIGGMGVLVFLLAVLPMVGGSHMNLMRAESPGPSVGKLVPKVRYTAMILYLIYIALTIIQIILLLIGKMPLFESMTTAFSTAGTGGLAIRNDSFMSASPYIQWVVAIFMMIFGTNFGLYFLIIMGKVKQALKHEEVRVYLLIMLAATTIIFFNIRGSIGSASDEVRHSFFQVSSIMTTTGFASADFNLWPETSKVVLVLLMFTGACAGSTAGGIKVSRIIILVKTFFKEIVSYLHPRSVKKVKFEGKVVEHEVLRATNVYFITYMLIFSASIFLISFENNGLVTSFTAVTTCINNIGPGLDLVGPTQTFALFSDPTKYLLIFNMLAGRLELFPLLILFCPSVWKFKKKGEPALQS